MHLSNALATGSSAIAQAIVVSFTGYMLYLTRRWAGTIWLAMPVHGRVSAREQRRMAASAHPGRRTTKVISRPI